MNRGRLTSSKYISKLRLTLEPTTASISQLVSIDCTKWKCPEYSFINAINKIIFVVLTFCDYGYLYIYYIIIYCYFCILALSFIIHIRFYLNFTCHLHLTKWFQSTVALRESFIYSYICLFV